MYRPGSSSPARCSPSRSPTSSAFSPSPSLRSRRGLERVSTNLDAAARTLGETALSSLWRVHLPLLVAPLGAAALLVFVDCMKELPATLLLRPFNFETLATHVYALASIEQLEQASLAALTIVVVGLVPVLLLHEAIAGSRPGGSPR
ncbi:MAG: hypothetical protein WDN31_14255 [Hyphomicrobium sp.]